MKHFPLYLLAIWLMAIFCGCSSQKVRSLEKELSQERAENAALKAELDHLRLTLSGSPSAGDSLAVFSPSSQDTLPAISPPEELTGASVADTHDLAATPGLLPEDLPVVNPAADFQRSYDQAMALFQQRRYADAADSFARLLESNPNYRLAGNCQYWIGECLYAQKEFENALAAFQKVLAFSQSSKADAAQFKLGLCFLKLNRNDEAKEEFNRLIAAYPNSPYVARARAQFPE